MTLGMRIYDGAVRLSFSRYAEMPTRVDAAAGRDDAADAAIYALIYTAYYSYYDCHI